jgi:F0F1-type ATP synthase assembly protein I
VSALYVLNIVFQGFYTLALPIGIGALASYLLVKFANAPGWIWAVLLTLGTFCGLFSMIKYLITAMNNLERLEKERDERKTVDKNEKQ